MQTALNRPLSPEILCSNIKYQFNCKDSNGVKWRYVGYFHRLLYCCGSCACVFTYDINGTGGVVFADAPAIISDLAFAPKSKSGIFKD